MFKSLAAIALAASITTSLSADEHDHVVNFDQVKFEASGRYSRHLISTAQKPTETFAYVYGKAKLVDGVSGQALDFSDSRSRTEFRMKSGKYYDHNSGTISFMLAPTKKKFGITKESVVFEESNGETLLGLYLDAYGKLKLKVTAKFPIVEEQVADIDKFNEKYFDAIDKPKPKKFENKTLIDKVLDEKQAAKDAETEAEEAKPTHEIREFSFYSFQLGDTSNWPVNEFQNIVVTWDLRKGFFAVLVNGKYAIRSFASNGNALGLFLDRGRAGSYINFGKGNDGFSGKIDNLIISKDVRDEEFDPSKKKK
ncbi:MAG: hypothetical protein NE328_00655 [Lentisphaeraceae bacterium]|nr:hypothetical protein [Lentisphaeraceae bacterium]